MIHKTHCSQALGKSTQNACRDITLLSLDKSHGLAKCQCRHDIVRVVSAIFKKLDRFSILFSESSEQLVGEFLDAWGIIGEG